MEAKNVHMCFNCGTEYDKQWDAKKCCSEVDERWICLTCEELHDDEWDAIECCADIKTYIACGVCEETHDTVVQAAQCCGPEGYISPELHALFEERGQLTLNF